MNTTFPLSGKTFCLLFTKLRHSGKLYPASGTTFSHMNKTKLFDLLKCFLGNRDNFYPYRQALSVVLTILLYASLIFCHFIYCILIKVCSIDWCTVRGNNKLLSGSWDTTVKLVCCKILRFFYNFTINT